MRKVGRKTRTWNRTCLYWRCGRNRVIIDFREKARKHQGEVCTPMWSTHTLKIRSLKFCLPHMAGLFLCSIGTNFTNSRFQFLAIGLNCLEDEASKFRRTTNRSVLTFKLSPWFIFLQFSCLWVITTLMMGQIVVPKRWF